MMHCARCSCPSEQVTFMIFIQYFGTELQLKAYQKLTERDPRRMSPADSRNLTCMLHKPLDCLLRASPPGHCYLQRDRTRTAPPRNPRQRRPGDAPLPEGPVAALTAPRGSREGARQGAGGGRGQGRAAASGVCGQVIRDPPARAAHRPPPGPAHATIAPPGRPPSPPPPRYRAPGTRDRPPQPPRSQRALPAPRSGTRPRAAPPAPGRGGRASYLSPREAAGSAPGCPSLCGPGGPPVTPAPSLAPAPARPRPAPATP